VINEILPPNIKLRNVQPIYLGDDEDPKKNTKFLFTSRFKDKPAYRRSLPYLELETEVFKLFCQYKVLTFAELTSLMSNQPEKSLTKAVNNICIYDQMLKTYSLKADKRIYETPENKN
jgi:hypothetical protein